MLKYLSRKNSKYNCNIDSILSNYSFFCRLLVPRFYVVLIIVCVSGKAAILFKKFNENRKDKIQVLLINQHKPPTAPNVDPSLNNQRWNYYLCGNSATISLLLALFLILIVSFKLIKRFFNEESAHLIGIFYQFILCNGIPLIVYLTNDKLYKHVKNEVLNVLLLN